MKGKKITITFKLIILIVLVAIITTVTLILFFSKQGGGNVLVPDNPASRACAQLADKQMQYNCLAIVNKDSKLCDKTAEDGILACKAIVENNPQLCNRVTPAMQKKTCIYEVARVNDNIASCDFADDKKDCVGSFLAGLYWDQKFSLMNKKYCASFPEGDRDWCLALVTQDKSVCGTNLSCLSLFVQPLSFCDNRQMPKSKGECLRDRAMTQRDPSVCELIDNTSDRNRCYFNIVGHIDPDTSFCSKISDTQMEQECFSNAAVKILLN